MSETPAPSARAHVLVVEDSSVFREMQGLLLRQAGYAVSGHESPQAALAEARQQLDRLRRHERPDLPAHRPEHARLRARRHAPRRRRLGKQVAEGDAAAVGRVRQNTETCASICSTDAHTTGSPRRAHASETR